jgi:hypothetical protein
MTEVKSDAASDPNRSRISSTLTRLQTPIPRKGSWGHDVVLHILSCEVRLPRFF